ncbi:MAG: NADH-quinone oxidoreductase subunit D, partial [Candidatus Marinimicrobia bacterium]|nr:NADH-quinone oxidoreductase subunit D [Candidatus Neomarinimicrobiota bacterium]
MPDLKTEEMVVQMGPQHPATHGVLRLEITTDGEIVKKIDPHIGYLHRCFEKHCEVLNYHQIIPFVDRCDYLAAMNNEHGYVMAVEKLLDIELPPRVEYIRVIMSELNRIASHLVALGTFGLDIGAITPFLFTFRDREKILDLFEMTSGARLLYNYIWIGGVAFDLPNGFVEKCFEFIDYFLPKLKEYDDLLSYNKIFIKRTAEVAIIPPAVAIEWGITGPNLRASGVDWDLRRDEPYSIYDKFEWDVIVADGRVGVLGDSWSR